MKLKMNAENLNKDPDRVTMSYSQKKQHSESAQDEQSRKKQKTDKSQQTEQETKGEKVTEVLAQDDFGGDQAQARDPATESAEGPTTSSAGQAERPMTLPEGVKFFARKGWRPYPPNTCFSILRNSHILDLRQVIKSN